MHPVRRIRDMESRLLQVLPSVVAEIDGEPAIEFDFCESLRLYLQNFDQVIIACPITKGAADSSLWRSRRVKELPWRDRVKLISLPNAYRLDQFLRHYAAVRTSLKTAIENADYLLFSPHSLVGDWPTVAVCGAIKLRRPYAIDADVVYDKVAQVDWHHDPTYKQFINRTMLLPLFQRSYRYCLEHSSLALLQGQDVYQAYSSFCANPHKVYHMPVSGDDYITEPQLQTKLNSLAEDRPLRLCYVGRCIEMKGPADWLKTLQEAIGRGAKISATWLGDGSLLESMRMTAANLGIADHVHFPGFVADRRELLRILRDSDLFVFCHKTPESPRCLVEALVSGCPLIGYGSAYPRDLVSRHGGGLFAPVGDWHALAAMVSDLAVDRRKVHDLIRAASLSGRLYERDATMQRRIDLIKQYLSPQP